MKNRDDCKSLKGLLLIDDAYWGGKKRDGKRGRGATGKMPLVAALSLSDKRHPLYLKLSHLIPLVPNPHFSTPLNSSESFIFYNNESRHIMTHSYVHMYFQ